MQLAVHLPDYVNLLDRERRFRWVNRLAPGLTWEAVEGTRVDDWVTPESRAEAIEAIERCFATGDQTLYRVTAYGDGVALAHYENRVVPSPAADGTPHVMILTRDVTAQVKAAEQLRDSEHRLARAMSSGRIGLWEFDPAAGLLRRDSELAAMLGVPACDTDPTAWLQRLHPDDHDRVAAWAGALMGANTGTSELEYRVRVADGSYRWFIDRVARQARADGSMLLTGVMLDVTELRRVEQERLELARQLEQAQRLESVGLLAGGIAHDFNNLLTIVQNSVTMASELLGQGRDVRADLARIKAAAERAASLTAQLLAFGRRSELDIRELDLGEVVAEVCQLVTRLLPTNITIAFEPPTRALVVRGDRHQLEQVLVNLCINARDAMPQGGELRLAVAAVGKDVELLVADSGVGIDAANFSRIFEPFYTSKPQGEGTGLGLAMVHGIVQQHGGKIAVASELGVGTQFRIRLPAASSPATRPASGGVAAVEGSGRLLVAEDEAVIREVLDEILTRAGYEVVTAVDGQDALDKWRADGGRFDLVVLDAIMPRMDGWRTYEQLRTLDPSVPILFASGYGASAILDDAEPGDVPPLLSKPYDPHTLLRVVGQTLAQARADRAGSSAGG